MPLMVVDKIVKSFPVSGGKRRVLHGVSFALEAGTVTCLVGPNGSGKTTLLKTICTLLIPDSGTVLLDGGDVHRAPEVFKRRIGFASTEDHSFYGRLTARMNLWFYAQLFGMTPSLFRERMDALSRELELAPVLSSPFRELSNGQKQRMLLARALLHDPDVIIFDEPHQNLDPNAALGLRHLLKNVWAARGKTLLISTHHLDEASRISDRWVVLNEGSVVFDGSTSKKFAGRPDLTPESFFRELTHAPAL